MIPPTPTTVRSLPQTAGTHSETVSIHPIPAESLTLQQRRWQRPPSSHHIFVSVCEPSGASCRQNRGGTSCCSASGPARGKRHHRRRPGRRANGIAAMTAGARAPRHRARRHSGKSHAWGPGRGGAGNVRRRLQVSRFCMLANRAIERTRGN